MLKTTGYHGYPFLIASPTGRWLLVLAIVWTVIWKGIALWKAGKNNQKAWFVFMFILNTLGILEIIYIFGFQRKKVD